MSRNTSDRKPGNDETKDRERETQQKEKDEQRARKPSDAMARLQKGLKFTSDDDIVKRGAA